jgi:ATP-dependent helicase/nuclease subunit B
MSVELYLAPAASGKTAYVLRLARDAATRLQHVPRVVVSTHLQSRSCRRRLAEDGGVIGVRVLTFEQLYADCLKAAGEAYIQLGEPVQYRLIRAVVDRLPLPYYQPLVDRPGFILVLQGLLGELKAARISPHAFAGAVAKVIDEPRLRELAEIYSAYQQHLQSEGWADRSGMAWLAVEALEERAPDVARDWPLLVVDGFDDFTEVQIALLRVLAGRVGRLVITLTGCADGDERPLVHRRFCRTRVRLQDALGVQGTALAEAGQHVAPALAHLEANLYRGDATPVPAESALELIEAPDRAAEVRAALRWLKRSVVQGGMRPGEVGLVARDVAPYRALILQTAAEFGLPIRLAGGLPLSSSPAVAALLDLLRLCLPRAQDDPQPALPRRLVIEAWRSPYFDWSARATEDAAQGIGIAPGDADCLDSAARWGRVIGGLEQWEEALTFLAARSPEEEVDEERGLSANVPVGAVAETLLEKLHRFVERLTPPQDRHSVREFVGWLETLIGADPELEVGRFPSAEEPTSLRMVARARETGGVTHFSTAADWDVAALRELKDVLRGLVWAEEAVCAGEPVDFPRFFNDLEGAVQAAHYRLPADPQIEDILVSDVVQARGLPFRAVAVLGLAEGEFPTTLSEDPFLRDSDRQQLREQFALPLEPSTVGAEAEFFYETVARARERLLLTRPRLADTGALWQPSPFWEEVTDWLDVQAQRLTGEGTPDPGQVASWPELMESLAAHPGCIELWEWTRRYCRDRPSAVEAATQVLKLRLLEDSHGPLVGDLTMLAEEFARRYGPQHVWSASRLEAYRTCPFLFFVASVLRLEPRVEPQEGLDARQLGNVYHRILERVYQDPRVTDPADLDQLLGALPEVAQGVLDEAPEREGFRATAWWRKSCEEIVENVRRSLQALHRPEVQEDFVPTAYERRFGEPNGLGVFEREDCFRLHGVIDRVDQAPDGRVRIVDYKTAGPARYDHTALTKGKKIQLPLYALGARDALRLGQPCDGFYWHVRHAQPSPFSLRKYRDKEGRDAVEVAVEKAWEAVRGVRCADFRPRLPDDGCPSYCPAAGFCSLYQPGYGG